MKNVYVIFNPVAGKSNERVRRTIEQHFREAGWRHEIYETTGEEQIWDVVHQALERQANGTDGIDLVVACGGDGTISGVAGGLVHQGVPLGILPLGTGNTLARELGIPLRPKAALNWLTGKHDQIRIDAMQVNERFFVLNLSVGLTGLMIRDTPQADKRRFGRVAYVWTGLRKLFGYQPHRFVVTIDGKRRVLRAADMMIANSGAIGDPSLRWSSQVALDDGQVDVLILRARTALDYLRVAAAMLLGRQSREPAMRRFVARQSVTIEAPRELPVQADGESIGHPPVEVLVVPNAVAIVVPKGGGQQRRKPRD